MARRLAAGIRVPAPARHGRGAVRARCTRPDGIGVPCRVYAPVGEHEDLLPYLVRRLLENGANTSFVNRIVDASRAGRRASSRTRCARWTALERVAHPRIPLPVNLFEPRARELARAQPGGRRRRCANLPIAWSACRSAHGWPRRSSAGTTRTGRPSRSAIRPNTARSRRQRAYCQTLRQVDEAIAAAVRAQPAWDAARSASRARAALDRAADLFEQNTAELVAMCVREAGKTVPDSIAEVREAVDFLRYYAARARRGLRHEPLRCRGRPARATSCSLHGRGVFACISPWNFPLAIFTGQVAAALAAGNAVVAKPAEQTPLVGGAGRAAAAAGGRAGARCCISCRATAQIVGARAVADPRVAGVAFTGSTETARLIHRALAATRWADPVADRRDRRPERDDRRQLGACRSRSCIDAVQSAFNSAGQRCSALRVLCVQEDIAPQGQAPAGGLHGRAGDRRSGAARRPTSGPSSTRPRATMLERHAKSIVQGAAWHHRCELGRRDPCAAPSSRRSRSRSSRSTCWSARCSVRSCTCCTYRARDLESLVDAINAHRLRADARHPQPHRQHRATRDARRITRRQRLRQPQHDRRRRRHAAVRRLRACRARGPRPAVRTTCTGSPTSARSPSTRRRSAAMPRCWRWSRAGRRKAEGGERGVESG